MKALDHTQAGHHGSRTQNSIFKAAFEQIAAMSETIWLCITFFLFLLMGPFSIIAVVYGLWALSTGENRNKMVEPASC